MQRSLAGRFLVAFAALASILGSTNAGSQGGTGEEGICSDDQCKQTEKNGIRVAFVHHAMHMGGVERQIIMTCAAVDREKILPEVVLFQEDGEWVPLLARNNIPVSLFRVWRDRDTLREGSKDEQDRMVQFLRHFDVVHTWYGGGSVGTFATFAALAARKAGIPVIQNLAWNVVSIDLTVSVIVVECDETEDMHKGNLSERSATTAEHLQQLGVTQPLHSAVILEHGFPPIDPGDPDSLKVRIDQARSLLQKQCDDGVQVACIRRPVVTRINPGVNTSRFDPAAPRLKEIRARSRESGTITVGRVSRLVPEKDPVTFVESIQFFRDVPNLQFKIWGDGPERPRLEELIRQYRLEDKVFLMGATEDVEGALASLDIFFYTTKGESVGWVILEAMAMGLPVLSTRIGAVPTFVRSGETGFLVDPDEDPESIGGMLELLVSDWELRERLGGKGRELVVSEYNIDRFGADYVALYEAVAAVDWKR